MASLDDFLRLNGILQDSMSEKKPTTTFVNTLAPGYPSFVHTAPSAPTTKAKATDVVNAAETIDPEKYKAFKGTGRAWVTGGALPPDTKGKDIDFWELLSVPYRFLNSSILTGGAMYQVIARTIPSGFIFAPDEVIDKEMGLFNENFVNAWTKPWEDITMSDEEKAMRAQEQPHNLDIGTSVQYNLGQLGTLGLQVVTLGGYGGKIEDLTDEDEMKDIATFNQLAMDNGFVAGNINFDPFSDKQRGLIVGDKLDPLGNVTEKGSGWNIGNVTVQMTNLAGDIAADPITYVPVVNLVKGGVMLARGSRYLPNIKSNTTVQQIIARDADNLVTMTKLPAAPAAGLLGSYSSRKAAEKAAGQKLPYWEFAKFAADNNAATIIKHPVLKSIISSERNQVAWLLGQVTTEADVARVLLATDYGSTKAFQELVKTNPLLTLALDEVTSGGYLARQAAKGINEGVVDLADNTKFYDLITTYSDELVKDDFSRILSETMIKSSTAGISMGQTAARELIPSTGLLTNKLNNFGAHVGSFIVHNNTRFAETVVSRTLRQFGSNKIVHQLIRPLTASAKGTINVEDSTGVAGDKFFGMIGDIDRLTGLTLSKEVLDNGLTMRQDLLEKWMKATTPQQRADVVHYANELGLTKLAEKYFKVDGLDAAKSQAIVQKVVAGLTQKKRIHEKNLETRGVSVITESGPRGEIWGEHIYQKPFLVSQTANSVDLWDWNKVNTAFLRETNKLVGGLYWFGDNVFVKPQRFINSLWQAILLFRPARILRDVYQNFSSIALSGYGSEVLKSQGAQLTSILKQSFSGKRLVDGEVALGIDRFKSIGRTSTPKDYRDALRIVQEEQDLLQDAMRTIVQTSIAAVDSGNLSKLSFKDLMVHLENAKELQSTITYHTSIKGPLMADGKPSTRFETRSIPTFQTADEASEYLATKTTQFGPRNIEETLTLPDGKDMVTIASPTRDKVFQELMDGNIVHIRSMGRGRSWKLLDVGKLAKMDDGSLSLNEVRVLSGVHLQNTLSRKDLADAITQGDMVWYKDSTMPWTVLSPDSLSTIPPILPKGSSVRVLKKDDMNFPEGGPIVPVKSYGETVTFDGSGKVFAPVGIDSQAAQALGIKNAKDFFDFIDNKKYDSLSAGTRTPAFSGWDLRQLVDNPGQWDKLTDLGVGRINIIDDAGRTTVIVNPQLADIGLRNGADDVFRTSQSSRLLQVELQKMGVTQSDIAEFFRTFDNDMGLEDIFRSPDPIYKKIADGIIASINDTHSKLPKEIKAFIDRSATNVSKLTKASKSPKKTIDTLVSTLGVDRTSLLATTNAVKQRLVQLTTLSQQLEQGLIKANKRYETRAALKENAKIVRMPFADGDIDVNGVKFSAAFAGDPGSISLAQLRKDASDARVFDASRPYGGTLDQTILRPGDDQYWDAWANLLNRDFMFNGQLDPVIKGIINARKKGLTNTEIKDMLTKWATTDPQGIKYANAVGIGSKFDTSGVDIQGFVRPGSVRTEGVSIDEFIDFNIANVDNHVGYIPSTAALLEYGDELSPNQIAEYLLAGMRVTPSDLAGFKLGPGYRLDEKNYGVKSLPDIWASKSNPKFRNAVQTKLVQAYETSRKVMTESPQLFMFQTPVFAASYSRSINVQMQRLTVSRGLKNGEQLKIDDATRFQIEKKARATALAETKKWIYSSMDGKKWEDAFRFIVPFSNAQLFTLRTLARAASDQPARLARYFYYLNKETQSIEWVDKNGNPVGYDEKDADGKRLAVATKVNLDPAWVKAINNIWGFKDSIGIKDITWSRSSMDPVYAGNTFDVAPGFTIPNPFNGFSLTPAPAIALSEITKANADSPEFAKWLGTYFPQLNQFGPSAAPMSLDILSPGGVTAAVFDAFTNSGRWQTTVLNSAQFLTGALINGDYEIPSGSSLEAEITKHAASMFWMTTLSGFVSPIATGYNNAGDLARKTWKTTVDKYSMEYDADPAKFKAKYGNLTPFSVAQNAFLTENPELFFATTRQNDRKYNQNVSPDALGRIRKYKNILDDVLGVKEDTNLGDSYVNEIMSFIVNEEWGKPSASTFDQNVWNTMISEGYINKVSPEEMQKAVVLAKAREMYMNGFTDSNGVKHLGRNDILNLSNGTGFLPDGLSEAAAMDALNRAILKDPMVGPTYSERYMNPDPQRFDTNFRVWWQIMQGDTKDGSAYSQWWKDHTDKGGMSNPLINDITEFLKTRNNTRKAVNAQGARTGVYRLSAYPQLQRDYQNQVALRRNKNPDFDAWYLTFFEGDTVN
jgi:hypothetical protein